MCLLVFTPQFLATATRNPGSVNETQSTAEYERALEQVRRQDFQGAISRLKAVLEAAPHYYQAFNLLGVGYERLGDHKKANQAVIQALQISPRFDEAHVNLGAKYVAQGQIDEGISEFKKAIQLNPRSASAYYKLGYTELQRGRPAEAAELLKQAYELAPHDSPIVLALIRALAEAGQTKEAVRLGEEVSRLQPSDPGLEMQVGLVFFRSEQWDAAQNHLKAAAKSDPALRKQIIHLGEKAFEKGRYHEALCLVNAALEFVPESAPIRSLAGACYYHLQNPALAVKEVQEAIHLDPRNEGYYIQLAQIFLDYNTPEPAVSLLQPALALFPSSARIRFVLGVAYLKSSKFQQAQQYLEESLRMYPQNPLASRALAMVYEGEEDWNDLLKVAKSMTESPRLQNEGHYYQAEAYYNLFRGQPDHFSEIEGLLRKSLASEPNFPPSHFLMGRLQLERGSYREAVESLNRAIALDPDLAGAYYTLAIAYGKLGDHQRSSQVFDRYRTVRQKKKESEKSLHYESVDNPRQRH